MTEVRLQLAAVQQRIRAAARAAGRAPESVRPIAVSKLQPSSAIREAYAAGQRDFGENYAQELAAKAEELADLSDIRWHMIGHLQRNKARTVVQHVSLVHSVHSPELVEELARRATPLSVARRFDASDARLGVLIEVNVGGETQKSGCAEAELGKVLDAVEAQATLRLMGLMCVPPLTPNPADAAPYFARLVALRDAHGGAPRLPELSMGMTADLEYAISAGASFVRVGTAIFGERAKRLE
jgi:pyridoxal phosphate enzyme (YggS family)